jgi:hypothetical protein
MYFSTGEWCLMLTPLPEMAFLKVLMVVQPPVFLDFSKLFKIAYN